MAMFMSDSPGDAEDHWRRALGIVEAGRDKWQEVPESSRSRWLSEPMLRSTYCGLIDALCRYFISSQRLELMEAFSDVLIISSKIMSSVKEETTIPTCYSSLTDYAALKIQHLVVAYRNGGFVLSKFAIMLMCGAATTGNDSRSKALLWRSPGFTREVACNYLQAAAYCADDDPERANYLCIALLHMCMSGHVSIDDIQAVYAIAQENVEAARLLFGDDVDANHHRTIGRVQKFIEKLHSLVASGEATIHSRLHPFPDANVQSETQIDQIEPTVFGPDEDESGWITPDGRFRERNPIFKDDREGEKAWSGGWDPVDLESPTASRLSTMSLDSTASSEPILLSKLERKNGKDDWSMRSYLNVYQETRALYMAMEKEATEAFAKLEAEGSYSN
ncbi:hypothetical protein FRB94_003240 [Tulasnella sp. JGI-2019a]|nr:hypothetical protein FRB94_003240 [Tulasnella sp. JGI-2019a]KAG9003688.1 hypothetical protein FRB93_010909 [Tulasnella sp. JGI-2019a]